MLGVMRKENTFTVKSVCLMAKHTTIIKENKDNNMNIQPKSMKQIWLQERLYPNLALYFATICACACAVFAVATFILCLQINQSLISTNERLRLMNTY